MKREELDRVLKQHRLWLESDGIKGIRANLQSANLRWANLQGVDLQGANLWGADLWETNLQQADLRGATLDINIRDCLSFYKAKFTSDALPWLILHPNWAEWKDSVQISSS